MMVRRIDAAGILAHFAREEAERRHQYYLGPEHLLLGLLVEDDNPSVTELRAHGLDVQVGDDNPATRVLHAHALNSATVQAGSTGWSPRASSPAPSPATPSCWPPGGDRGARTPRS